MLFKLNKQLLILILEAPIAFQEKISAHLWIIRNEVRLLTLHLCCLLDCSRCRCRCCCWCGCRTLRWRWMPSEQRSPPSWKSVENGKKLVFWNSNKDFSQTDTWNCNYNVTQENVYNSKLPRNYFNFKT